MRCVIKLVNSEEVGAQLHGALGSQRAPSLSFHPEMRGPRDLSASFTRPWRVAPRALIPSTSILSQQTPDRPSGTGTSADTWHLGGEVVRADGTRRPCQHLLCTLPKFCLSFRTGHN